MQNFCTPNQTYLHDQNRRGHLTQYPETNKAYPTRESVPSLQIGGQLAQFAQRPKDNQGHMGTEADHCLLKTQPNFGITGDHLES